MGSTEKRIGQSVGADAKSPKIKWSRLLASGIIGVVVAIPFGLALRELPVQTKKEIAVCQKDRNTNFVVKEGTTIKTEFFGPRLEVKITKISADHVELFGTVPYLDNISNMNETVVIPFGGTMTLHVADPSGKHYNWTITAEKGSLPRTAQITLSN
jgi:hypothetical protein